MFIELGHRKSRNNLTFTCATNQSDQNGLFLQKNCHVLLIEDDQLIQKVSQRMLEIIGCNVDVFSNGEEALKQYSSNYYDAIVTDIGLPGINGIEVVKAIRSMCLDKRNIPIIALTAFTDIKAECLAVGINEFLNKPVDINDLQKAFKKILPSKNFAYLKNAKLIDQN